jgi:hypothetical protein
MFFTALDDHVTDERLLYTIVRNAERIYWWQVTGTNPALYQSLTTFGES